jgi:hypothetical protein
VDLMPLSFIIFIIVFLIGLVAVPAAVIGTRGEQHSNAVVWGTITVFSVLGMLLLFNASATLVPTRSIGVEVSFGRPVGKLDNGFHLVLPWHKVEKFDTRKKTIVMRGDGKDADAGCVNVRLGNQTTACVDVNRAQWNINPDGDIISLYRQFKSFDTIEHAVVMGQITNGLVNTLSDFDPLATVNGGDAATKSTAQLSTEALTTTQAAIDQAVGDGVKLDLLQIFVNYNDVTQQKLNDYAKAIAETRIAQQNGLTAAQNAKANKALTDAGAAYKDPGVQYQNCLNLIRDLATRNQLGQLPATFNCGDPRSQVIVQGRAK